MLVSSSITFCLIEKSLNKNLTISAQLADKQTLSIYLCLSAVAGVTGTYSHALLCMWLLEIQTESLIFAM